MTDTQVPIIGWQKRYMTPHECARLQSLDGLKKLPDSPAKAFAALGNAVNSNVVEMVTRALLSTHMPTEVLRKRKEPQVTDCASETAIS